MDRLEQPAGEQPREFPRITAICLDAITRPLRHEARRDDRALDTTLDKMTVETEAGRARLVATAHPRPAAQHALDCVLVIGQRPLLEQLVGANRRQSDRARVHVQPDRYRRRLVHGRRPPYVALPGTPRQPTTNA